MSGRVTKAHASRARGLATGLLAAATLLQACSRAQGGAAPATPAVPVVVAVAEQRDVTVELQAVGTVEAQSSVAVRPQVGGTLEAAHFIEGADVKAGDLLFTIDPRPYRTALAQAEANLARDRALSQNAAAELKRAEELLAQGILSREQHDQTFASAQSLAATVRADEAAQQTARLQLGFCSIRSPIDGRTGSLLVKPGNLVKAVDGGPLVQINQIDPILVAFAVPETRFARVKSAAGAGRLAVRAQIQGEEQQPLTGELNFLDNQVERDTGTLQLKARFANPERRLWPGQFVGVRLALDVLRGAVVIPAAALGDGQNGRYVFVVKPDRTVELRDVETGEEREGDVVIAEGLAAGETVVTDGQVRLVPGAKVEPRPAKGAPS